MKTLLLFACLFAQNLAAQFPIWSDPSTKKYGICNPLTGEPTYGAVFDEARLPFGVDTIVFVKKEGLSGLISITGRVMLPLELENIVSYQSDYLRGFVAVEHNGLFGLWNIKAARQVLPAEFEYAQAIFPDLIAGRQKGREILSFFDENGQKLFEIAGKSALPGFDNNSIEIIHSNDVRSFCDKKGQPVFPEKIQNGRWTDGLWVIVADFISGMDKRIAHSAILNASGDTILPWSAFKLEPVGTARFLVKSTEDDRKMGLFDAKNRQWLAPVSIASILKLGPKDDPKGVFLVQKLDANFQPRQQILDSTGNLLFDNCHWIPFQYSREQALSVSVSEYHPDRYFQLEIVDKPGSLGLFASDGRPIVPMEYQQIWYFSDNQAVICSKSDPLRVNENLYDVFDLKTGKKLLTKDYQNIQILAQPNRFFAKKDNKWGLVNLGEEKYARFEFEQLRPFQGGCYLVKQGAKYLLFRSDGELAVHLFFDQIIPPTRDHYFTFKAEKNTTGKLLAVGIQSDMTYGWFAINDQKNLSFIESAKKTPIEPESAELMELVIESPVVESEDRPISSKSDPAENTVPTHPTAEKSPSNEVYEPSALDVYPAFPGGPAILKFIADNLRYPPEAQKNGIQGRVLVTFIVEKEGDITNLKLVKDIGGGCGQEALRLVQSMPKWTPGEINGKSVRAKHSLSIPFNLN